MNVREKLVEQAISHFWYGISHDIFSEPVTTYAKLAIEALKKDNGVTVSEWISVDDRLPDSGKCVLVYSKDGGVAEGVYNTSFGMWTQFRWNVTRLQSVTHWMPLPDAPKEGEA
mgnify:CR=1 FL=1